ncbi:hypothetical protein [Streptomyces sp. NPDC058268]|uniref:hypothetical protein n=1 Tax=Streptomyces sp. NPDC058268 TaxID=3346413 RepID=UPI0036EBE162
MPDEDRVPPGPHRELLVEIHRLHAEVGWPGLHKTSSAIKRNEQGDLPATLSHQGISKILRGESFPEWLRLESLVRQYLAWNFRRRNEADANVQHIQEIWMRASMTRRQKDPEEFAPTDVQLPPREFALKAAQVQAGGGDVFPLLSAAAQYSGVLPLALALMATLPDYGLRLLEQEGQRRDDASVVDFLNEIRSQPSSAWSGQDPYLSVMRGVFRFRPDYGAALIGLLRKQDHSKAISALMVGIARTGSPVDASDFLRGLSRLRSSQELVTEFLGTLSSDMPHALAQRTVDQLRTDRQQRAAQTLESLMTSYG